MRMRLRQVALVAADLDPVEQQIQDQLGVELCFRDPGVGEYGLHNGLFPIGDKFLEVVAPTEDGTTAGRLLDKRGGDGGYMVLLQVDDLTGFEERLADLGVRIVSRPTGAGIVGRHLHPKDIGGAIVSIDETDDWDEWGWAGPTWREHVRTDVVLDLIGVTVQSSDPDAMAARWSEVLDRPVLDGAIPTIELDEGEIEFVPDSDGRGDGISVFTVRATDENLRVADVGGVQVRFSD